MEWEPRQPMGGRMRAPDDGIVTSGRRPRGWLGEKWQAILQGMATTHGTRLARGRSLAHSGRVRDLWFAPGLANAEVVDSEPYQVSLRVRVLEDEEWDLLLELLHSHLLHVARLLEGGLPAQLLEEARARGLDLFPAQAEIDGDCNCGDYMVPCAHLAAVHTVVAEALDGDPFLLLTLRGRSHDHVMTLLREKWGDDTPLEGAESSPVDEPVPGEEGWYSSPESLPRMQFQFKNAERAAAGLLTLGPPPGEADLLRTLEPLYEAGARSALELAHADRAEDTTPQSRKKWYSWRERMATTPHSNGLGSNSHRTATIAAQENESMARSKRKSKGRKKTPAGPDITEALVDKLADLESAKSKELADALGVSVPDVRTELIELEKLGVVYRTGQTRGTRWWLG